MVVFLSGDVVRASAVGVCCRVEDAEGVLCGEAGEVSLQAAAANRTVVAVAARATARRVAEFMVSSGRQSGSGSA
ncbi:hypothetical protein GCM10010496_32880 [Streptomyces asoensis]|nr:hypothetical protein GCM10010496_32880 [Streptomyces asoensis]